MAYYQQPLLMHDASPTLFTVGYGGRPHPEEIVGILKQVGVILLVDVRESPRARVPGFSGKALARYLPEHGISYRHIRALGNKNRRNGPGAPVELVDPNAGASELEELMVQGAVAIMCACRRHQTCHRNDVGQLMEARVPGLLIQHLY